MASANVDLVRSIYAAWECGDFSSVEWADPEIEFVIADGPEPCCWKGLDGMAEDNRATLDAWEDVRIKAEAYRALDLERVLVLIRHHGLGKISRLETEQMHSKGANLFHVQGGKVTKLVVYFERQRALVDLLREDYEAWARDS
jgi:hypothetical protein